MIHKAQCQLWVGTAARSVVRASEGTWLPRKTIIEFTKHLADTADPVTIQLSAARRGSGSTVCCAPRRSSTASFLTSNASSLSFNHAISPTSLTEASITGGVVSSTRDAL